VGGLYKSRAAFLMAGNVMTKPPSLPSNEVKGRQERQDFVHRRGAETRSILRLEVSRNYLKIGELEGGKPTILCHHSRSEESL
jgi:hypothetical protein